MKKQSIMILLIVMIIFLSLLIGFYLGRNTGRAPVQISKLPDATTGDSTSVAEKININTATADELQKIPGIGPSIAQRIIDYRENNGAFETISELTKISGIGLNLLDRIMDYLTV